jgi:hypothetical protein
MIPMGRPRFTSSEPKAKGLGAKLSSLPSQTPTDIDKQLKSGDRDKGNKTPTNKPDDEQANQGSH